MQEKVLVKNTGLKHDKLTFKWLSCVCVCMCVCVCVRERERERENEHIEKRRQLLKLDQVYTCVHCTILLQVSVSLKYFKIKSWRKSHRSVVL